MDGAGTLKTGRLYMSIMVGMRKYENMKEAKNIAKMLSVC